MTGFADHMRTTRAADLYFMQAGDAVKIGRTSNLKKRQGLTQTHCPMKIELLGCVKGAGWSEKVWHHAFHRWCRHGEWYALTDELNVAMRAALEGREWIAELQPTDSDLKRAKADWQRHPDDMQRVFGTPYEYARRNRCERVADFEERLAARNPA